MRGTTLQANKGRTLTWSLWLIAMLYLSRDSMYSTYAIGFTRSYVLQFALFVLGCGALLYRRRGNLKALLKDRRVVFSFFVSAVFLLPMAAKRDWQLMYFSVLFVVLYSVLVTFWMDVKELSRLYVVILGALSVCSILCTYGLRFLADSGIAVPPYLFDGMGGRYYNYGVSLVFVDELKWRSLGIFREPGVYQFFLILALYLNNDVCNWEKPSFVWALNILLGMTMLTTLSFGGIAELALLVAVLFFEKGWYRNRKAQLIAVSGILALVIAYNVIHWLDGPLWGEIWMLKHKFTMGGESVTDRFGSIFVNTKLFLHSPLFGDKASAILYHPSIDNNTSSTTILMAMFGILGALLHIFSWIALTWKKNRCFVYNLFFALILAMSFNTENMITDLFLWLFPIMAVWEKCLSRREVRP